MTQEEWMQEGMDLRLVLLLLLRKTGYIIGAGIVGALLAGGVYLLTHVVYAPAREYQAVSRYYIDFTVDENGDRAYDYYNAATWNDVAASDPILDYTMSLLPEGYDRTMVQESVFCEQPSDYRIITTTVTTHSAEQTEAIQKATEASILHYGEQMEEFEKITVIMSSETALAALDLHTVKVFVLGAVGGMLLTVICLIFGIIFDTAVYVESTFERRYGYPVLGVFLSGRKKHMPETERQTVSERKVHFSYLGEGTQMIVPLWDRETEEVSRAAGQMGCKSGAGLLEHPELCSTLRQTDGVILAVRSGKNYGKQIEKAISILRKQDCKITGAILYKVPAGLYRAYYCFDGKSRRKEKEQA